jgi:hypothetical protein
LGSSCFFYFSSAHQRLVIERERERERERVLVLDEKVEDGFGRVKI